MVFFAVAREGLESVFFRWRHFNKMSGSGRRWVQCSVCYCRGARLPALLGRYSPQSCAFFKWTSLFILFVAAGLAAVPFAHFMKPDCGTTFRKSPSYECGALNSLAVWHADGRDFCYQEAPSVSEVAVWFIYLIPGWWHLLCHHAQGRQRLAPRNNTTQTLA